MCVCMCGTLQANAGDSRAIACVDGRVRELSHDHKPTLPGNCSCQAVGVIRLTVCVCVCVHM